VNRPIKAEDGLRTGKSYVIKAIRAIRFYLRYCISYALQAPGKWDDMGKEWIHSRSCIKVCSFV
jgi:hypothetical protein